MIKLKLRAAMIHLLVSLVIGVLSASVIFLIWFPAPFTSFSGAIELWLLIVCVEVSLGPLISIVIYNPIKSRVQLVQDYTCVAVLQITALLFGMHTAYGARPVALVFVKDRFDLVTLSDLSKYDTRDSLNNFGVFSTPFVTGVSFPVEITESNALIFDAVLSGRDIQFQPIYYSDIAPLEFQQVLRSTELLCAQSKKVVQECESLDTSLRWIPVNNNGLFGIALVEPKRFEPVRILAYDPWELGLK